MNIGNRFYPLNHIKLQEKMKLNLHLLVNIMTVMRMGFTNVFAVELIFRIQNQI